MLLLSFGFFKVSNGTWKLKRFLSKYAYQQELKVFLEISLNSRESTCARVSFLIKLQAWVLQFYLKSDAGTGVFLWILRNFWRHLKNSGQMLLLFDKCISKISNKAFGHNSKVTTVQKKELSIALLYLWNM